MSSLVLYEVGRGGKILGDGEGIYGKKGNVMGVCLLTKSKNM